MLKLANQVIDIYDDTSKEGMRKLAKLNPTCNVLSAEDRAKLGDHEFALTIITKKASKLNKFPICDKDSTWLSNQYFDMNAHKLPPEAQKVAAQHLMKACSMFHVEPCDSIRKLASVKSDTKLASSNVYYENDAETKPVNRTIRVDMSKLAQVEDIGSNYTHAQYAMPTTIHVKMAAKYLGDNESKIPLELRHKYAAAIQRRSHELGMGKQAGIVGKYASDHYSPMVDAHIKARASLLEAKPDLKGMVEKIGSAKRNYTPSQFAQILHGFDKQAGLSRYYGAGLTDPFQATFASQPDPYVGYRYKTASQTVLEGDELAKLVNIKYAKIKEYFGEHLASELRRDPTVIFESLPRDAKEIIVGMADGTH